MSLRDRLFKPRWQHRDPEVRAAAVASLNDEALRRQLPDIARNDQDLRVRQAAFSRLSRFESLLPIALHESDEQLRHSARQKLLPTVLAAKADDAGIQELLHSWNDSKLLERIACEAQESSLRRFALERCQRQGFLGQRASQEKDAELRAYAVSRIEQESTLKQVAERLRKVDKQLYRQVQERLSELSGIGQPQLEKAERLCQQAQLLARGQGVQSLSTQISELEQAWSALDLKPEETQQQALITRFNGNLAILRKALAGPQAEPEPTPEPKPSVKTEAKASTAATEESTEPSAETAKAPAKPEPTTPRAAFGELQAALDNLLKAHEQQKLRMSAWKRWQQNWAKLNKSSARFNEAEKAIAQHLERGQQQIQQALDQQQQQRQQAQTQLQEQVEQLAKALDDDQLKQATKIERSCFQLMRDQRLRPTGQWRELHGKLEEQRKYLSWSNQQHREQLIEEVEALKTSELHPDALIQRLRDARQAWQKLDETERHSGLRAGHKSWNQFNDSCNQVMETVKPFLDKRSQVRSERAVILRELVDASQPILADDTLDRKALQEQRSKLIKALRELSGVPRQQRQALAQQIRGLLDQLDKRLDALEQAAIARKERLIKKAQALAEVDLKEAITQAKALQQEWRGAGFIRRAQEQKLWTQFREHINPLFEQLDAAREQRQAEHKAQQVAWQGLVDEAETLVTAWQAVEPGNQSGNAEHSAQWQQLTQRWGEAQVRAGGLIKRFEAVNKAVEHIKKAQQAQQEMQQHQQDWQQADAWQAWAQQQLKGESCDAPEASSPHQQACLGQAQDALAAALTAQQAEAAKLCLAMEFLSGLDSPADQQQARMAYQVERLAQRMVDGAEHQPRHELQHLHQQWFAIQPLHPDDYPAFAQRFRAAWEVAIKTL